MPDRTNTIPKPPAECTVGWCAEGESCTWEPDGPHGWTRHHEARIDDVVSIFTVEYRYGREDDGLQDIRVDVLDDDLTTLAEIRTLSDALEVAAGIVSGHRGER
ncbi:hypothetical protein [Cellulosimicrobium sp. 72-3]|nr:hypothetical protein [Cellulosimicrobium sp. 72-3]